MTEAIKQWIADQAIEIAKVPAFSGGERVSYERQMGAVSGLTKGIEIAEGFAEWVETGPFFRIAKGVWNSMNTSKEKFTTSQLLEKYLEHLSSINKEK